MSVAKCPDCGRPIFKCVCEEPDQDDKLDRLDLEDKLFEIERGYMNNEDGMQTNYGDKDKEAGF